MKSILESNELTLWSFSDAPRETINLAGEIIGCAETMHKLIIAHGATHALDTQEKLERDITIAARKLNEKITGLLAAGNEDA